jgi:hypothetical protein
MSLSCWSAPAIAAILRKPQLTGQLGCHGVSAFINWTVAGFDMAVLSC